MLEKRPLNGCLSVLSAFHVQDGHNIRMSRMIRPSANTKLFARVSSETSLKRSVEPSLVVELVLSAGDFDVPSSREEVDRDSLWNQWLRSEVAATFVSALDVFKVCSGPWLSQ